MEGLNIITLSYLFFRLAPFIIICYFSLSSVFNQDIKGLIYLAGLMFACVAGIMVGSLFGDLPETRAPICNMITIGNNGSFSKIPIGIIMLAYTFFYLLYIMIKYSITKSNFPTIILFSVLIAGDIVWNITNNCYSKFGIIASLGIGVGFGYLWGMIVDSIGIPNLLYLNVGSDQTVCSRPAKQLFKCTFSQKLEAYINISKAESQSNNLIFTINGGSGIIHVGDTFNLGSADKNSNIFTIVKIGKDNEEKYNVSSSSSSSSKINVIYDKDEFDTTIFEKGSINKIKVYTTENFANMEAFSPLKEGIDNLSQISKTQDKNFNTGPSSSDTNTSGTIIGSGTGNTDTNTISDNSIMSNNSKINYSRFVSGKQTNGEEYDESGQEPGQEQEPGKEPVITYKPIPYNVNNCSNFTSSYELDNAIHNALVDLGPNPSLQDLMLIKANQLDAVQLNSELVANCSTPIPTLVKK
jgi:hypothetical protein